MVNVMEKNGLAVVSSRLVAQNFGKRHSNVLQTIDELIKTESLVMTLFIESYYRAGTGKRYKEYLITRDGFSLLVMGFNGKEALQWKLQYIAAFNEMEELIKREQKSFFELSKELKAIFVMDQKQQQLESRVVDLENNMTIDYNQQEVLRKLISMRVYEVLGNGDYNAKLRARTYRCLHQFIKKRFRVSSYKNIIVKEFHTAKLAVNSWGPSGTLKLDIQNAQKQMALM